MMSVMGIVRYLAVVAVMGACGAKAQTAVVQNATVKKPFKQMAPECPVSEVDQFILVSTECHGYHRSFGRGGLESKDQSGWVGKPVPALFNAVLPDCFEVDFVRVFDAQ